jgi:hypothetical protein
MYRICLSALAALAMVGGCGRLVVVGDVTDGGLLDRAAPHDSDTTTEAAVESCSGDAAPGLVTLASGQNPNNLVVKATGVYWTRGADAGSTVMSLPLGGGVPTTIVAVQGEVQGLAVDATHAYWTEVVSDAGAPLPNSVVMSVPLAGGTPTTIASGQVGAGELAVDSTSVYWTTGDATIDSVMKVALDGGTPTTLASRGRTDGQPGYDVFIAVDNSNVYWAVNDDPFFGVVMVPLQGGVSNTLASETSAIYGLAVDTTNVYWTVYGHGYHSPNPPTGAINKMPLAGGVIVSVAMGDDLLGLAVDGTNVYWTSALGSVYRVPVSGGTPVTLSEQYGAYSPSTVRACTGPQGTSCGSVRSRSFVQLESRTGAEAARFQELRRGEYSHARVESVASRVVSAASRVVCAASR